MDNLRDFWFITVLHYKCDSLGQRQVTFWAGSFLLSALTCWCLSYGAVEQVGSQQGQSAWGPLQSAAA